MDIPIAEGYNVWSIQTTEVQELKSLEAKGIVTLRQEEYLSCTNCNEDVRVTELIRQEGVTPCPNCKKAIAFLGDKKTKITVQKVNRRKIRRIIQDLLLASFPKKCTRVARSNYWLCEHNGKKVPVFISEISSYNQYINNKEDLSWLCIVINWSANRGRLNNYNQLNFLSLQEIIADDSKFKKRIEVIATDFAQSPTVDLVKVFDDYVDSCSADEFEKVFVDNFICKVKEKRAEVERYLSFLSIQRNSIVNAKIVFMGSSANPDFALINIFKYLQNALQTDKIGETKRYQDRCKFTKFEYPDFCVVLGHARGANTLSIISTNKIAPSVWRQVIEERDSEGNYKNVILEKDTLLLLIKVLGMEDLLKK
jgi:hypothetical protein